MKTTNLFSKSLKTDVLQTLCNSRTLARLIRPVVTLMLFLTIAVGNAWGGTKTEIYSFATARSTSNTAYGNTFDVKISGKDWNVPGNQNFDGYVRIGGKNLSKVDRVITGKSTIGDTITLITLNHGGRSNKNLTVNSISIVVSTVSNFSTTIDTSKITSPSIAVTTAGSLDFRPNKVTFWPKNAYYKIIINVTNSTSTNYGLDVKTIKFYKETFGVTYDKNGGTGTMTDGTAYVKGRSVTVKANSFTAPSGYAFDKWNTKSDGSGADKAAGATFALTQDTTLYAIWKVSGYTITYNSNGGSGSMSNTTGATVSAAANGFTAPAGKQFTGWNTAAGGGGTSYAAGDAVNATVTLYAQWSCITPTISSQSIANATYAINQTPVTALSVTASGGTLSYQWQSSTTENGAYSNVAGATSSSFTPPVTAASDLWYRCVVTNTGSSCNTTATSNKAHITVSAGSTWKLKGDWDSWTEHAMAESAGVASYSISLAADSRFEFGIDDNGTFYKNNGTIITTTSGWTFNTSDGNCHIHTGPAGSYTFAINTTTKAVTVTYPTVSHPNEHYVYFKNTNVWPTVYGYLANSGNDNKAAAWPGSVMQATTSICGETYHYAALNAMSGTYNVIIFNNGSGGYGNQTSDLSADGLGKFNANTDANWHDFKHTITFAGNGNTGGSMTNVSNICIGSDQTLASNGYTKTDHTFTGWTADVDVKIGGSTVTAGELISDAATIQDIQSNITLTAQWVHVPVIELNSGTSNINLAFGDRAVDATTGYEMTFTVSGQYLTENIAIGKSGTNAAMFTVDHVSVTQSDGTAASTTVTVTYKPSATGSHSATLTLSSAGATNRTVTLTGTGKWKVTFLDGYGDEHSSALYANGGTPVKPGSNPSSCDATSTTFMGWTQTAWTDKINQSAIDAKTAANVKVYTSSDALPTVANHVTYYPVFAKEGTGYTNTTVVEDFEKQSAGTTYNSTQTYTTSNSNAGIAWYMYYGTVSTNNAIVGSKSAQMRWYESSSSNYPYTQTTTALDGLQTIKFRSKVGNTNVKVDVLYSTNSGSTWDTIANGVNYSTTKTEYSYNVGGTQGTNYLIKIGVNKKKSSAPSSGNYAFFVDSVALTYKASGTTYSEYMTSCCDIKAATGLVVTSVAANSVSLSWTAPSPTTGITKLQVVKADGTVMVDNLAANATSATVTGLTECDSYTFKIKSVGSSCDVYSATVDAQPFSGAKTVTYNYHDGIGSPASFTTSCGNASTTLPTPTRENYRFDGWYDAETSGSLVGAGGASYTPSANITLHAYWTRVYTVTYNYMGGTSSCSDATTYAAGATVTVCATPPTKSGSSFQGWLGDNGVGTKAAGTTFTMPAANVTLTAQWQDTPYTLTHNGSNYSNTEGKTSIKSGDTSPDGLTLNYTCTGTYGFPGTISITGGGKATWTAGEDYTWTVDDSKQAAALVIAETIISADVTVSITMKTRYAVTYNFPIGNISGTTGTLVHYFVNDEAQSLKEVTGVSCLDFDTFEGWTLLADTLQGDQKALKNPVLSGSYTATGTTQLYAMYSHNDATATGYKKITSDVTAGTYLIATDAGKAYKQWNISNTYGDTAHVTVSSGTIAVQKNAREITITMDGTTGNFYMYDAGKASDGTTDTKYLSYSGSSNNLKQSSSNSSDAEKWKLNNSGQIESVNVSGRLLQYNASNPRFACYTSSSSQTDAYLFKKGGKIYNSVPSCAMYDVTITDTDDGTVTTSPAAGTEVAPATSLVTVNVTPDDCKYLSALSYNDGSDDYNIDISSTPYTFTMPEADVTVTATFSDKSVTSIAPATNTNRILMQGTSFVGERIRVTYNSGETEDLEWDDAAFSWTGDNTSTLGTHTVTIELNDDCVVPTATHSTSYTVEITDGVPVTYYDGNNSFVRKYELNEIVGVDTISGKIGCVGYTFVGWSETAISTTDDEYVPVHNFAATTARTLYAVYALQKKQGWMSIENATCVKSGAEYLYVKVRYSDSFAMSNTASSANSDYLAATLVTSSMGTWRRSSDDKDFQTYSGTPAAALKWQVIKSSDDYYLYNADAAEYLKVTSSAIQLTATSEDNLNFITGGNDCEVLIQSSNSNYYASGYYTNPNYYFNPYESTTSGHYLITRDSLFTTMPPCVPRSVTFHGNGGIVSDGVNEGGTLVITEENRGDGITTPVATMDAETDCNGNVWEFIGWLDAALARTQVPVLTTDLLNDGGGNHSHSITADDEEYYAVYSNTGMPETKYGTINLSASDFSSAYPNSLTSLTKEVAGMDSYTFKYIKMGYPAGIGNGIQMHQDEGYLYNETSLGKINSISLSNIRTGSVNNLKVYVSNDPEHIDTELTSACRQLVGNVYTYYPAGKYAYVKIADVGAYVTLDGISIDFGKGSTIYASTPDCTLRVTYKADGEEDHVVEIGGEDSHNLPAYYPAGCDGKDFIGWAEAGIASLQQTAPAIYTADGSLTGVSAPKTLYAVFASRNGGKNLGTTSNMFTETWYRHDWDGTNRIITGSYSAWSTDVNETPYGAFIINSTPYSCLMFNVKDVTQHYLISEEKLTDLHSIEVIASSRRGVAVDCSIYVSTDKSDWECIQTKTIGSGSNNNLSKGTLLFNLANVSGYTIGDYYVKILLQSRSDLMSYSDYNVGITSIRPIKANRTYYLTDYSTTCETASTPVTTTWAGIDGSTIVTGTEPENVSLGTWLTLPTLSKDNYRFDGWKATINNDQKADVYLGGETFLINHPVTFTAQWTEMFEVSDPAYGVTSYKDITTTSGTFSMTVKGSHSITPVVDGLTDDTHFAVTITTPGTDDSDDTDFNYTFTYTPDDFGTGSGAATHTATFRFKDETSGVVSEEVTIRGRSLPEEFVIAVKNNDKWYALPGNLQSTNAQPAIVPVEILVNDATTPTSALLAPQTALYKAANRYQNTNTTALRFTTTGSNYLQVSTVEGTYNMWLSNTGGTNVQDWQLHSADFNAYELTIPSNAYPTKKMGIYNGSYMGYHTSPSNSQIYLLPVVAEYTPREAKVKEWGRYAVVVEVATADIATVRAHIDNAAPGSVLTPQPVNVATIAGAKNLLVNTVDAIDFSAQEGHSLYLDWYNSSSELIATSQISVPLIIAENKTMSGIDAVKTHWEKKEVHVLPGVKLTADANTFASGNVTVKTLEVYPNATLHISAGTLNTTDLNLRCGWTRANGKDYDVARVFIDPAALTKTHAAMQYDIFDSEEGKHYYPLAVPFSTPVSTIDYADDYLAGFSTYGTHYVIKDYDGALRAENGVIDENWRVIASDGTLQPGRGYIITAVAVKGEALIRIPLSFDNAWTSAGEKATVEAVTKNVVPVVAHTGAASAGESANNRRHAGWNILGVPFMSCYTAGTDMYDADALIKGNIVIVGGSEGFAYQNTSVPYVSVPTHNFGEYIQTDITDAKLLPGWSFFVQVGTSGNLTFSVAKQREDSDTPLYAPQRTDKEHLTVRAALVLAGNGSTDKTTLIISDHYEAATYEIGADLEKMFGNGYTLATYTVMEDGTRLVFNALAIGDIANSVPVGFRAPDAGEYTFALDDTYPTDRFERLDLIDYKEGTLTNLLENSYTFTTDRTQDDTRFALNVVLRLEPKIPTATNDVTDTGSKVEKRIVDGCLTIIRNGRIYDATGKLKVTTAE